MIGLFIMVIVTLSLVAGASASVFFVLQSAQSTLALQQNQVRIQSISDALKSRFTIVDGKLFFPLTGMDANLDTATNNYLAKLPTDLVFTKTSLGQPITFCPIIYEPPGAFTATHKIEGGKSTYDIDVENSGIVGAIPNFRPLTSGEGAGYSQLDAQSLNKSGIYGFLVSPDPQIKNASVLDCNDIVKYSTAASETFIINGGTVSPIFANSSAALPSNYIVSASGSGVNSEGQVIVHSIADALTLISRNGQSAATILFSSTTDLTGADISAIRTQIGAKTITFASSNNSIITINPGSGAGSVLIANGSMNFKNLDLSTFSLNVPVGSNVTLDGSTVGATVVSGGTLSLATTSSISAATDQEAAVIVKGGHVDVATTANPAINMSGGGASFMIYSGSVAIAADLELATGMTIYPDPTVSSTGIPSKPINLIGNHVVNGFVSGGHQIGLTEFASTYKKVTSTTTTSCNEAGCTVVASCPANLKAVEGDCATTDQYPLASFGIFDQGRGYACDWSTYVPVQNYNSQSPAYRTPQSPAASVICVNP